MRISHLAVNYDFERVVSSGQHEQSYLLYCIIPKVREFLGEKLHGAPSEELTNRIIARLDKVRREVYGSNRIRPRVYQGD